ncbi:alkane 1-monooxygenase [Bdellovibrio bacteriovorus]|uniref:alkane 1-monooxygenase n=1 Tax=Bdellovibrio bacteriovorus TaxID=959 RepID=UPI0035A8734F
MKAFLFYSRYSLPYFFAALALLGAALGGPWTYLGAAGVFVLHPLIDNLLLKDQRTPAIRPSSPWSLALLISALPFLSIFAFVGILRSLNAETYELVGLILSFGTILGLLGISTAHELVHRKERELRELGFGLLSLVNFSHYGVEHVFGHHKNVGTLQDPATARKNEWIYTYFFRSYFKGLWEAFFIEHRRLRTKGFFQPLKNRVVWWGLLQTLMTLCVYALYGEKALCFWIGQSLVAILLLQTVDYIEHYGLLRKKNSDGQPEGVKAQHSWDNYQALTNYALINLGFHSHHHLKVALPFTDLQEQKDAPQMPYGYSAMALMALVPPLYFRVMNPRLPPESP